MVQIIEILDETLPSVKGGVGSPVEREFSHRTVWINPFNVLALHYIEDDKELGNMTRIVMQDRDYIVDQKPEEIAEAIEDYFKNMNNPPVSTGSKRRIYNPYD